MPRVNAVFDQNRRDHSLVGGTVPLGSFRERDNWEQVSTVCAGSFSYRESKTYLGGGISTR